MSLILDGTNGVSDIDGTATTPAIRGTDANTGIFFPVADTIAFSEGGAEVARFDALGNLGIGTAIPLTKLHVDSSSTTYSANIRARNSNFGNGVIGAASGILTVATDMNNLAFYTASNLGVDGTSVPTNERMRIDSSGRVLIGTTTGSPSTANAFGVVVGTTESNTVALGVIQASASGASALVLNRGTSDGSTVSFYRAASAVGTISVTSSATSYNTSSDYRLKENIAPMMGALATVSALKPVTYKWKVDGSDGQGFIAHELQEIVPDCVSGAKDAVNEDGSIKSQGIDTSFLVATLTAAIQELKAIVDAQATRIAALEA